MSKKWSLILAALSITPFSFAKESENQDRDTAVITISSKIRIDKDLEDEFLKEAKDDGKMLTKKWASVRGVSEIETTVDRDDCGNACKCETVRSEGGSSEEVSAETKCACGKPATKSCSKCSNGKCCSSCSSCSSCCK